jgi:hemerythrin-like domain-containing protein
MSTVIETLEHDHHFINQVVATMAVLADELQVEGPVDLEMLRDLVQFMRIFAEQCHHGKEEQHLFAELAKKPLPDTWRMLGLINKEHVTVHALTNELAHAVAAYVLDPGSGREPLIAALRGVVAFYPRHIWKEEYLVFPVARQLLSAAEQEKIARGFGEIESEIGPDVHRAFESLARFAEEAVSRAEMAQYFVTN